MTVWLCSYIYSATLIFILKSYTTTYTCCPLFIKALEHIKCNYKKQPELFQHQKIALLSRTVKSILRLCTKAWAGKLIIELKMKIMTKFTMKIRTSENFLSEKKKEQLILKLFLKALRGWYGKSTCSKAVNCTAYLTDTQIDSHMYADHLIRKI